MADGGRCASCGRWLDEHDRSVRFRLPDRVQELPEEDRRLETWDTDVFLAAEGAGTFVRILVPVRLTGGHTVTFGAWMAVAPDELDCARQVWWTERYVDLVLEGSLANALPSWPATLDVPVRALVRHDDNLPYANESSDALLQSILADEWPHEDVLAALPSTWPFTQPPEQGTFLARDVYEEEVELTTVTHDDDGDWHFCGDEPPTDASGWVLAGFAHVVERWPQLRELSDLLPGSMATLDETGHWRHEEDPSNAIVHDTDEPVRDDTQRPVPHVWRDVLEAVVACMVAGDWTLSSAPPAVARLTPQDARMYADNVEDYGDVTLIELPGECWTTSVCLWHSIGADRWEVLVDLWTAEEGCSDLVLFVRLHPDGDDYRYEITGLHVP